MVAVRCRPLEFHRDGAERQRSVAQRGALPQRNSAREANLPTIFRAGLRWLRCGASSWCWRPSSTSLVASIWPSSLSMRWRRSSDPPSLMSAPLTKLARAEHRSPGKAEMMNFGAELYRLFGLMVALQGMVRAHASRAALTALALHPLPELSLPRSAPSNGLRRRRCLPLSLLPLRDDGTSSSSRS